MAKKAPRKKSRSQSANRSPDRASDFERFYHDLYADRWPSLRQAMAAERRYHALSAGLERSYYLDEASYLAASYLEAKAGERILDLCAAPGGKSLSILSNILSDAGEEPIDLTSNERSASRRGRMKKVFAEHLPPSIAETIKVTGHDAARWGQIKPAAYDRIILDVPCSSERHVVQEAKYLAQWSESRSNRLAQQAYSFALSALQALKPGGGLLYATCALSTRENDDVIDRVLTRILKKGDMAVITDNSRKIAGPYARLTGGERSDSPDTEKHRPALPMPDWVEATSLGFAVLPDRAEGRGPMYFSRIKKL